VSRIYAISAGKADGARVDALTAKLQAIEDTILSRHSELSAMLDTVGAQRSSETNEVEMLKCKVERTSEQVNKLGASFEESLSSLGECVRQKSEHLSQRKADISIVSALEDRITSQLGLVSRRINEIHDAGKTSSDRVEQMESRLQVMGASMKQKVNQGDLKAAMEQQSVSMNAISASKADNTGVQALAIQLQATEDAILSRRNEFGAKLDSLVAQQSSEGRVETLSCKVQKYGEQLQKLGASFEESQSARTAIDDNIHLQLQKLCAVFEETRSFRAAIDDNLQSLDHKISDIKIHQSSSIARKADMSRVEQLEEIFKLVEANLQQASSRHAGELVIKLDSSMQQVEGTVSKLKHALAETQDMVKRKVDAAIMEKFNMKITSSLTQVNTKLGAIPNQEQYDALKKELQVLGEAVGDALFVRGFTLSSDIDTSSHRTSRNQL